jgi:hypothetical protein
MAQVLFLADPAGARRASTSQAHLKSAFFTDDQLLGSPRHLIQERVSAGGLFLVDSSFHP